MSNKVKAAFIAVAPEGDKNRDRTLISSGIVELLTVIVKDYNEAVEVAKELLKDDYKAIELCAGFGHRGVSMISKAISYKIPVGVVRFDNHPAFNNQSGDNLF